MQRSAHFSRCRQYRYALWRRWAEGDDYVLLVALNPSTADHRRDDPTIRRCIGFARDWGYSALCVANLFAYRATYPSDLFAADDPVGPRNDQWLSKLARDASLVVAGWGNHGRHGNRAAQVRARLGDALHCLRMNGSGEPAHPLYLPKALRPIPMPPVIPANRPDRPGRR
ncbi:DUF1643 domain-containing protein [Alloalcanivorax xenomutans]|jgi:hypothetical protein|uniref:DUF1643 domain-containing protein n=1 Tax=Alloalcanivorax xenomutans TaxID=1094342 RepID=UPI0006D5C966|nr:DUF1643 domain-containing protein [Alloalcanivorax xenomutans]PHS60152.1 MAG: DUF1643 domain-containing protein [Alcanivorax sp.]CUR48159.1 hypothetical protein BN2364_3718 [Alloalcanivorax xenomutans]